MWKVTREIDDVLFDDEHVQELRQSIKQEMLEEDPDLQSFNEARIEARLREKLVEIARSRTLYDQGDNDLTRDIEYGEVVAGDE